MQVSLVGPVDFRHLSIKVKNPCGYAVPHLRSLLPIPRIFVARKAHLLRWVIRSIQTN